MKGPRSRYRFVIRRKWRCPACQRIAYTAGSVTSLRCTCPADGWMNLVDEPRKRPDALPAAPAP
jgi:hypothetical protein